jgi:hypothetical protein
MAAQTIGQKVIVVQAATKSDCETAFASLARQHVRALLIQADPFFNSVARQLVALARLYSIAVMYGRCEAQAQMLVNSMRISQAFKFEAAHRLPNVPAA